MARNVLAAIVACAGLKGYLMSFLCFSEIDEPSLDVATILE